MAALACFQDVALRHFVHRQHHLRAGGELDFGHAEEGAPAPSMTKS